MTARIPRHVAIGNATRIVAIFLCFCGLLLAQSLFSGAAQTMPPQAATATAAARNAALIGATNEVLKETSGLRELSIMKAVQSSTQSRDEIQRAVIKNLDEETSPADLHASEVFLKRLGLAPADFRYRDLMVRLLTEQVAGYYEPKTKQFYLADWIDVDGQRPVMAHELTHALQDQHFNLRRFEKWPKGDSDAELAAHALIEGDATLAMVMYIATNPLRALTFLKSIGTLSAASEELNKSPRAIRESLLFPYEEGLNWTRDVYRRGGWSEVSQAFTTLPQSTEQILHPEKYFAHEAPVKVMLPDLVPRLNAMQQSRQSGWRKLSSDVEGEWGLYLILDQFLKTPAESRQAAAGWAGDRLDLYENSSGEVVYVSSSKWDSEADAREFFDAYAKRVSLQYPSALKDPDVRDVSGFRTSDGEVLITIRGASVFVVATPASVQANQLMCVINNEAPNCRRSVAVIFSR